MPANPRPACHWPSWNPDTIRDSGIQSERHQESQAATGHVRRNLLRAADGLPTRGDLVVPTPNWSIKVRRVNRCAPERPSYRGLFLLPVFFGPSLPPVSPSSLCYISPFLAEHSARTMQRWPEKKTTSTDRKTDGNVPGWGASHRNVFLESGLKLNSRGFFFFFYYTHNINK